MCCDHAVDGFQKLCCIPSCPANPCTHVHFCCTALRVALIRSILLPGAVAGVTACRMSSKIKAMFGKGDSGAAGGSDSE